MATAAVYLQCCRIIGGCLTCFETLTRQNPLAPCPNCREGRVIAHFSDVRGLDVLLDAIRDNELPQRDIDGKRMAENFIKSNNLTQGINHRLFTTCFFITIVAHRSIYSIHVTPNLKPSIGWCVHICIRQPIYKSYRDHCTVVTCDFVCLYRR